MTARQLRRAQEHKERKLARKAELQTAPDTPAAVDDADLTLFRNAGLNPHLASDRARMLAAITAEISSLEDYTATLDLEDEPAASPARLAANRRNAQRSTGPATPEGKATSSLNSLKTGLTGRTVLLPSDDLAAYQAHCLRLRNRWQPEGDDETVLVQSIADTEWRLLRIPTLEYAIYAKGCNEVAAQTDTTNNAASSDPALLDLETFLRYEKQLRNLTLQEGRLNRQRDKQIAELRQLQSERRARHTEQQSASAPATKPQRPIAAPAPLVNVGFVFSTAAIAHQIGHFCAAQPGFRPSLS